MRYCALALAALLAPACVLRHDPPGEHALRNACEYLWSQQSSDGGWHSRTYGLLKSGQSLTPFVLNALLQALEPGCSPSAGAVDRALAFLKHNTNVEGAVGKMDPLLYDYPNYATALTVLAIRRAERPGWREAVAPLVAWLRTQQFTEAHGWKRSDAAYGAWGIGGEPREAPYTGHVDLSMTRYVLQALAAAEVDPSDPVFARARVFVDRCQNPDGGFFFSTVVLDANKAGQEGSQYRSYGTTTADGILALVALGARPEDEKLCAARHWLASHDRQDGAPGFVGPAHQRWTAALRFYYAGVGAEAFGRCSQGLADSLFASQQHNGRWSNPEILGKEDDPLIATAFAVEALSHPGYRLRMPRPGNTPL